MQEKVHHQRMSSLSTCRKWSSRVASGISYSNATAAINVVLRNGRTLYLERLGTRHPWWTAAKFCLRCVHQQVRARFPIHRRPEWAPAFVTHCSEHFGEPLRQHCLCCHRHDPGWMIVARGRHGDEVHCKYCAVPLRHWSRVKPAPLSASLQVTLQLESTLIDCLVSHRIRFGLVRLMRRHSLAWRPTYLALLTQRDYQDALTLADHLAATDWWDDHVLGYQAVTAVERQEHAISRRIRRDGN